MNFFCRTWDFYQIRELGIKEISVFSFVWPIEIAIEWQFLLKKQMERSTRIVQTVPFIGRVPENMAYLPWCSSLTVNFLRPLARREANTRRPFFVAMRSRKPCLFTRRRLWGWNVLFILLFSLFICWYSKRRSGVNPHFGLQNYTNLLNYARNIWNLAQLFTFFSGKCVPLHPK